MAEACAAKDLPPQTHTLKKPIPSVAGRSPACNLWRCFNLRMRKRSTSAAYKSLTGSIPASDFPRPGQSKSRKQANRLCGPRPLFRLLLRRLGAMIRKNGGILAPLPGSDRRPSETKVSQPLIQNFGFTIKLDAHLLRGTTPVLIPVTSFK